MNDNKQTKDSEYPPGRRMGKVSVGGRVDDIMANLTAEVTCLLCIITYELLYQSYQLPKHVSKALVHGDVHAAGSFPIFRIILV